MVTLNEYVEYYAKKSNISKTQAREEITRFIENFKIITVESGGISINGFIKSSIKVQKAKEGINPRTKEKISILEKKRIKVNALPSFAKMLEE